MKLLVLYPYIPYPLDRGTHQRTFHLLRELARRNEVTLLALAEGGRGREHENVFREFCERAEFVTFQHPPWAKLFPKRLLNPLPPSVAHWTIPGLGQKIEEMLRASTFDAVHVCDIVLGQYYRRGWPPLIFDRSRVDLQFQLAEHSQMNFTRRARLLRCEGYAKLWFYERKMASRAALEIVCGPDDERFLRRWVRSRMPIDVVPNGVDLDYFSPDTVSESRSPVPTILFCGAMDYNPNIDALRWFFEQMHEPLLQAIPCLQVLIVGKDPVEEVRLYRGKPGVVVTGSVADVRPYYRRAWLQIVPLRIGGGTRLKILESMAMGTPVVSTRIGAQGLGLENNCQALLAESAEEFIRLARCALGDAELRSRIESAAREYVRARLSWESIGSRLSTVYSERLGLR